MRMVDSIRSRSAILVLLIAAMACLASAAPAAAPTGGAEGVTFSFLAPDAQAVFLAGDFNGWNAGDLALVRDGDGVWSVVVPLEPGQYEYKFVVDDQWLEDPDNPDRKSDPFGGSNSLLKIGADGSVGGSTAATPSARPRTAKSTGDAKLGRPVATDDGVLFTYGDANAGSVSLAGTFNDWSADALPLSLGGNGVWSLVHPLPAGKHEYKFVVDGAWFADPENPETQADPYGGANSLVTLDDDGNLIASAADEPSEDAFSANTTLNARVNMNGRYLTRFEVSRGQYGDPRFRMQRPLQTIDLNFDTEVSDVTHTLFRMRMDSGQNIIQNNIAGFLDEAYLQVVPESFLLKAYWNQEIFTGEDPMRMGGDVDLPGTIGPDHLNYGKGTAGMLFEAHPFDTKLRAFFANVYNQDYYNDPELYDNTGQDRVGLRLSREFGPLEIGIPAYLERSLINFDFSALTGTPPTGIPALDTHLEDFGDTSEDYFVENHRYHGGLDLGIRLRSNLRLRGQAIAIDERQRLIWGNKSGQGESAGAINVPFYEREQIRFRTQIDWQPRESMQLMAQHTWGRTWGADPDHRDLEIGFLNQVDADNRVYFTIEDAGPELDRQWTEVEYEWHGDRRDLKIWAWRQNDDYDFGAVGRTHPDDETLTMYNEQRFYLAAMFGGGEPSSDVGRTEFEFGVLTTDTDLGRPQTDYYEMIFRYDLDLSRRIGFIADVRYINFPRGPRGQGSFLVSENQFVNPFIGFRYQPIRAMELVLAYGVDPLDYTIDYEGRQVGRWWYRQQYLFDNPDATQQDAEAELADARVITLRAQVRF